MRRSSRVLVWGVGWTLVGFTLMAAAVPLGLATIGFALALRLREKRYVSLR